MRFVKHTRIAFATFALLSAASPAFAGTRTTTLPDLLSAMNQARAAYGLGPLHPDATLARAARAHSLDMLRHDYFAHGAFATRMTAFGARGPVVGENLAWGAGSVRSAQHAVPAWLTRPE